MGILIILKGKIIQIIPIPKKGNAKECSNYCIIALISHASKVMLKIHQARLQQYVNRELPDVQAGFRNGWRARDQIANIRWMIEKAREFQKNIYFCFIDYAKAFDCVQFSSVTQSCPTPCDPMNRSTQSPLSITNSRSSLTHVHRVSDAIQPSHPLSSPFPPAPNPSQHQSLFQWVNSSYEVAKVLEFQL